MAFQYIPSRSLMQMIVNFHHSFRRGLEYRNRLRSLSLYLYRSFPACRIKQQYHRMHLLHTIQPLLLLLRMPIPVQEVPFRRSKADRRQSLLLHHLVTATATSSKRTAHYLQAGSLSLTISMTASCNSSAQFGLGAT